VLCQARSTTTHSIFNSVTHTSITPHNKGVVGGYGGKGAALRRKRHQARSKIILKHDSENHVKADHVQSGVFHP